MLTNHRENRVQRRSFPIALGLLLLFSGLVILANWATPAAAAPLNQTVPIPTATPVLVAPTATPVDGDSGGNSGGQDNPDDPEPGEPSTTVGGGTGVAADAAGDAPAVEDGTVFRAVIKNDNVSVYDGPGTESKVIGTVSRDQEFFVVGRNTGLTWYVICCLPDGKPGWVQSRVLKRQFDLVTAVNLPVITDLLTLDAAQLAALVTAEADALKATTTPLTLSITQSPRSARPGQALSMVFAVANTGTERAVDVLLRYELPSSLHFVDFANDTGLVKVQSESPPSLLTATWPVLEPGETTELTIQVRIADDVALGAVIDSLVVLQAADIAPMTTGSFLGMPPALAPDFR